MTLDYDLQCRAEEMLEQLKEEGNAGAAVVLEPTTGEVLAISSFPDFDPNLFVLNSDPETLASYVAADSNSPLYNRAVQGSYIPGSTVKPLIAAMALDDGVVDENYEFTGEIIKKQWTPKGYWPYPPITRVSNYSGPVNMSNAITKSDNIYFADGALKAGWEKLEPFLKMIGFDERIPFDLRVSKPGYLNSDNYENMQLLAATGYGQGELIISPLQMACIFSSLANNGDVMTPRLVRATRRMEGTDYAVVDEYSESVWKENIISDHALSTIVPMLRRVVEDQLPTTAVHKANQPHPLVEHFQRHPPRLLLRRVCFCQVHAKVRPGVCGVFFVKEHLLPRLAVNVQHRACLFLALHVGQLRGVVQRQTGAQPKTAVVRMNYHAVTFALGSFHKLAQLHSPAPFSPAGTAHTA